MVDGVVPRLRKTLHAFTICVLFTLVLGSDKGFLHEVVVTYSHCWTPFDWTAIGP